MLRGELLPPKKPPLSPGDPSTNWTSSLCLFSSSSLPGDRVDKFNLSPIFREHHPWRLVLRFVSPLHSSIPRSAQPSSWWVICISLPLGIWECLCALPLIATDLFVRANTESELTRRFSFYGDRSIKNNLLTNKSQWAIKKSLNTNDSFSIFFKRSFPSTATESTAATL